MQGINLLLIGGFLARDPETRTTSTGKKIVTFTIGVNDRYRKDAPPMFLKCDAWEKTGDVVEQFCRKGSSVIVQGSLKQDTFKGKDGVEKTVPVCNVEKVTLGHKPTNDSPDDLEPRRTPKREPETQRPASQRGPEPSSGSTRVTDKMPDEESELPF